jgi:hypothetical protein
MNDTTEHMTASTAARHIGCSVAFIHTLHRNGELPAAIVTVEGVRVFAADTVLAVAEARRTNPPRRGRPRLSK